MNKVVLQIVVLFVWVSQLSGQLTLKLNFLDGQKQPMQAQVEVYDKIKEELHTKDHTTLSLVLHSDKGIFDLFILSEEYKLVDTLISITEDTEQDIILTKLAVDLKTIDLIARQKKIFTIRQLKDVEGTPKP